MRRSSARSGKRGRKRSGTRYHLTSARRYAPRVRAARSRGYGGVRALVDKHLKCQMEIKERTDKLEFGFIDDTPQAMIPFGLWPRYSPGKGFKMDTLNTREGTRITMRSMRIRGRIMLPEKIRVPVKVVFAIVKLKKMPYLQVRGAAFSPDTWGLRTDTISNGGVAPGTANYPAAVTCNFGGANWKQTTKGNGLLPFSKRPWNKDMVSSVKVLKTVWFGKQDLYSGLELGPRAGQGVVESFVDQKKPTEWNNAQTISQIAGGVAPPWSSGTGSAGGQMHSYKGVHDGYRSKELDFYCPMGHCGKIITWDPDHTFTKPTSFSEHALNGYATIIEDNIVTSVANSTHVIVPVADGTPAAGLEPEDYFPSGKWYLAVWTECGFNTTIVPGGASTGTAGVPAFKYNPSYVGPTNHYINSPHALASEIISGGGDEGVALNPIPDWETTPSAPVDDTCSSTMRVYDPMTYEGAGSGNASHTVTCSGVEEYPLFVGAMTFRWTDLQ